MKMCSSHFHDLHKAVKQKGMKHLVSINSQQATQRMQAWRLGTATEKQFDPLLVAVLEIAKKAEELISEYHPHLLRNPSICPLCVITEILKGQADREWIDNVTDLMLLTAKQHGLMRR